MAYQHKLTCIVPCYNEEEALPIFYKAISDVSKQCREKYDLEFEILFIDDGSKDKTLELLKGFSAENEQIRYISFSRNFGKEGAMLAGLENATGDYVVIMDADMQDPPSLIPEMYEMLLTGEYDSVATRRVNRDGEPPIRSFFARMFYKIINKISDADIVDGARDFRMMSRSMVDAILSIKEYNRFTKGIFGWVGFRTKWLPYKNIERSAGSTKWSFWKLFKYSLEGITAFSTTPLVISSVIGIILCIVAFLFIVVILIKTLAFGDPVDGWPSMMCVILLLSGIQLFFIGIMGQYIAKTYLETKRRPIYIIRETNQKK